MSICQSCSFWTSFRFGYVDCQIPLAQGIALLQRCLKGRLGIKDPTQFVAFNLITPTVTGKRPKVFDRGNTGSVFWQVTGTNHLLFRFVPNAIAFAIFTVSTLGFITGILLSKEDSKSAVYLLTYSPSCSGEFSQETHAFLMISFVLAEICLLTARFSLSKDNGSGSVEITPQMLLGYTGLKESLQKELSLDLDGLRELGPQLLPFGSSGVKDVPPTLVRKH